MKTNNSILFYIILISIIVIILSITVYLSYVFIGFNWKEMIFIFMLFCIGILLYKYCEKNKKKNVTNYWNNMKCKYLVIIFAVIFIQVGGYLIKLLK